MSGQDNQTVSVLRCAWQGPGAGWRPTLPRFWGEDRGLGDIRMVLPCARGHLPGRKGGSVCSLHAGSSPFLGRWPGTKRQGPEQRDLYAAPSPRSGSQGPVFFSSRAAGIQWAETLPLLHCGDTNVHSPQGLPRRSMAEGERPALLQRADCALGPRERAGPGQRDRSQPEPCGAAAGRAAGQAEVCGRG